MTDLITLPRAVVRQALEALENSSPDQYPEDAGVFYDAKDALRAALAQPRQFTSFAPKPPSPPPAPGGYDGTEAGLQPFSWRGNE
jgi:hypothetical protein